MTAHDIALHKELKPCVSEEPVALPVDEGEGLLEFVISVIRDDPAIEESHVSKPVELCREG